MEKKKMIYGGLALGVIGGATAFMVMNRRARNKAKQMLSESFEDVSSYFEKHN